MLRTADPVLTGNHSSHDDLLQVSRRLDWRFLLPDPQLGCVAYLGMGQGQLLEALGVFSQSIDCFLTPPGSGDASGGFDLVVIEHPSDVSLSRGAALVGPEGYLYIEARGWAKALRQRRTAKLLLDLALGRGKNTPRPWYPGRLAAGLRRAGFVVEAVSWHWPDFESTTRIIPLDRRGPLAFALPSSGAAGILRRLVRAGLLPLSLLAGTAPCFSILARRRTP